MLSNIYQIKSFFQKKISTLEFNEIKEIEYEYYSNRKIETEKVEIIRDIDSFLLIKNNKNFIKFNLNHDNLNIEEVTDGQKIIYSCDLILNTKNIKIDNINLNNLKEKNSISSMNLIYELYATMYEFFKMKDFFDSNKIKNFNEIIEYSDEINNNIVLKNLKQDNYSSLNSNLRLFSLFLNMNKEFYTSAFNSITKREDKKQKGIVIKNNNFRAGYQHEVKKDKISKYCNYCYFENEDLEKLLNSNEKNKIESNKNIIFETLEEIIKIKDFNILGNESKKELDSILEKKWNQFNKKNLLKPKI